MTPEKTNATIVLLASDALEATEEQTVQAALLLMDAALSIMVTCHIDASARREMAGMLAQRLVQQVEELIKGDAA